MITNLSGFPSSLTVIPVPEGDLKKHRELFLVNENLKRLGCSGRVGFQLADPSGATAAKFHQLYRTSDKIPFNASAIELVKLCQVSLVLFDKLGAEFADGLLCDVTERAINDWWVEFGTEHYNVEPHDGILGPTTVSALLGMLMGARNRLHAYGAPVSKDVFDIENTKRGIAYFQRSERIKKSRRLDRRTIEVLRRVTAKATTKEGWMVPRAVKSTVAELSGKGGEMVMDMVGGRDRSGIAEVETVDIERFVELAYGERAKWLWYGKPRKGAPNEIFNRQPGEEMVFQKDDQGGYSWSSKRKDSSMDDYRLRKQDSNSQRLTQSFDAQTSLDGVEREDFSKRAALKKATTKMGDPRSGFERIKDAVGRRGHQSKHSRDERLQTNYFVERRPEDVNNPQSSTTDSPAGSRKEGFSAGTSDLRSPIESSAIGEELEKFPTFTTAISETPRTSSPSSIDRSKLPPDDVRSDTQGIQTSDGEQLSKSPTAEPSVAGSVVAELDLPRQQSSRSNTQALRRPRSFDLPLELSLARRSDEGWPRHLSFSLAEDSILTWKRLLTYAPASSPPPSSTATPAASDDPTRALRRAHLLARSAELVNTQLAALSSRASAFADAQLARVSALGARAANDAAWLEGAYAARAERYRALERDADDVLELHRVRAGEAARELEQLAARLEYEVNALRNRVEDVEDGVEELERQVVVVEERVAELEEEERAREGWAHWLVRVTTGLGRRPGKEVK